jgi:hypothetical protein
MRLKKLGAALVVVAALGAVLASGALAAATTSDATWRTGASGTVLSGSAGIASEQVGESTFATTVSGQAVELHSTNIECEGCTIENSGGTAVGAGKLVFTGVTVAKPAGCSVASTITTKALKVKADYMIETQNYILFEPSAGTETGFATIELTGLSCPIGAAIVPKGTLFTQSTWRTGFYTDEQEVESSSLDNGIAGGSLHVGTEAATLTGRVAFMLTGIYRKEAFGTHE